MDDTIKNKVKDADRIMKTDPVRAEGIYRAIYTETGGDFTTPSALTKRIAIASLAANKYLETLEIARRGQSKYSDEIVFQKQDQPDQILQAHHKITKRLRSKEIVAPSKFWQEHLDNHIRLLTDSGLHHFKRTVGHNYINFLTTGMNDVQFSSQLKLWPVHGSMAVFEDRAEPPGAIGFMDVGKETRHRLANTQTWNTYRFMVGLMWDYAVLVDQQKVLSKIDEPLYGNPLRIWRRDRLISQDLTHSTREYNQIKLHTNLKNDITIVEIGSGYGRLAHLFYSMGSKKYILIDISPALLVAQNYLHHILPRAKFFDFRDFEDFSEVEREFEDAEICFLSADQISYLPDKYADLFINVCSLMEMKLETIDFYFKEISRICKGYLFTKQWHVQKNSRDNIILRKDDYPIPAGWALRNDRTDPGFRRLFEQVWEIK